MGLPALARSHQFKVDQVIAGNASATVQNQNLMFAWLQSLLGVGTWKDAADSVITMTGAWVCVASSDGSTFSMAGVNKILTASNIVFAAAGVAHSWIVVEQTGIATHAQILIDCLSSSQITIKFSATGFGVARGGTDGTILAAPTGLNEHTKLNAATWGATLTVNTATVLHVSISSDGKDTQTDMFRAGFLVHQSIFQVPSNPLAGWTTPSYISCEGVNTAVPVADVRTYASTVNSAATHQTAVANAGTSMIVAPATLGFADISNGTIPQLYTAVGDVSAGYNFVTGHLCGRTAGSLDAAFGIVADRWFGDTAKANGFGFPGDEVAAGLRNQFVKFGPWIRPWKRTTPLTS